RRQLGDRGGDEQPVRIVLPQRLSGGEVEDDIAEVFGREAVCRQQPGIVERRPLGRRRVGGRDGAEQKRQGEKDGRERFRQGDPHPQLDGGVQPNTTAV